MSTPEELRATARQARAEAAEVRLVAAGLDRSHVHALPHLCGERTWVGPTATEVQGAAARGTRALADAATALRLHAARLEQEAADLERAARRAVLLTGQTG